MQLARSLTQCKKIISCWQSAGLSIGFVPTMGALHAGHLSLVSRARKSHDRVVVSIFVNPTQFGPQEDFAQYPRDLIRDKKLLARAKIDLLFVPTVEQIYPQAPQTLIQVNHLSSLLCGKSRPDHFAGVATVVVKLLNIVEPTAAYFGEKDYQQLTIIRKVVDDLNIKTKVIGTPIIRDPDGLAMSSRNRYLTPAQRISALSINRALQLAVKLVRGGNIKVLRVKAAVVKEIQSTGIAIDYVEIVDSRTLESVQYIETGKTRLLIAGYLGKTRLIDNIKL